MKVLVKEGWVNHQPVKKVNQGRTVHAIRIYRMYWMILQKN
jgi:predicted transcriptional regulator